VGEGHGLSFLLLQSRHALRIAGGDLQHHPHHHKAGGTLLPTQVIENRCIVTVSNPYRHEALDLLFAATILDPIQEQLKSLGKESEAEEGPQRN
jgi:hypothetical protein